MAKHVTAAAKNPMKQVEGRPVEMTELPTASVANGRWRTR